MVMTPSENALTLLRRHEGLRLTSYRCPAGVWTIGYGHTRTAKPGQTISPRIAEQLLIDDAATHGKELSQLTFNSGVTLSQNQYDALLSFVFNLGIGALRGSTLWRKIKANPGDPAIADEFRKWVYAGGKRLRGLINRREEEARLYFA